jgi:hypothetical protein
MGRLLRRYVCYAGVLGLWVEWRDGEGVKEGYDLVWLGC